MSKYENQYDRIICKFIDMDKKYDIDGEKNELWNTMFIGDVLEWIEKNRITMDMKEYEDDLIVYWRECGFTKSLQEIYEESGVISYIGHIGKETELKDKNAEALFTFLEKL